MTTSNLNTKESSVMPFESAPFPPGASSPQQAALIAGQESATRQNNMNKTGGKRGRNKKYRGGAQTVPTFSSTGPGSGTGGQSANGASASANMSLSQSSANSACDTCYGANSNSAICQGPQCNPGAMTGGGSCSGAGGLIPNGQPWGCLSGGKRKSKKSRKSKNTKKSKKSNKGKKSKKSKKMKKSSRSKKTRRTKKNRK